MTRVPDPIDVLVQTLIAESMRQGETALADFIQSRGEMVAEICRANPRQPDSPTAERENPFLYTMR